MELSTTTRTSMMHVEHWGFFFSLDYTIAHLILHTEKATISHCTHHLPIVSSL
jgi:hypothetical protein